MRVLIKCAHYVEYDFYGIPQEDVDMFIDWAMNYNDIKSTMLKYEFRGKTYLLNRDLVCGLEVKH